MEIWKALQERTIAFLKVEQLLLRFEGQVIVCLIRYRSEGPAFKAFRVECFLHFRYTEPWKYLLRYPVREHLFTYFLCVKAKAQDQD